MPRTLSTWGLWLLVVNGLIGGGIFGLPSGAANLAGEYSIFLYIICALLMLPVILCFAELGSYYRGTGGPLRYVTDSFGVFTGFQAGWLYYFARMISFSANSVLLVDSIGFFVNGANTGTAKILWLLFICGGFIVINVIGSVRAIASLAVFTVLKFLVLILVIGAGIVRFGPEILPIFDSPAPPAGSWGSAAILLVYAFVGFESAAVPAGETKNPKRSMPMAYLLGLVAVASVYILIQMVCLAVVPDLASSTTPLIDAASELVGETGAVIMMLGIIASVGGNLLGGIFSTPRITYAMALENCLPSFFSRVHPRFLTPANSIIVYGVLGFIMAVFGSFTWLAASTIFSRLILYILTCASVPKLRQEKEGFRLPAGWLFPVLGIGACLWLMSYVSVSSVLITLIFVAAGALLFYQARKKRG